MFALSVLSDFYPQRHEDYEPTWLNRVSERLRALLRAKLGLRASYLDDIAKRVQAEGTIWLEQHQSAADRGEAVRSLSIALRKHGFAGDDQLIIRSLALACSVSRQTLGLDPHPPQIAAAYVLLQGQVVELDTGEGKSLTAALAAVCAALAGLNVHVITVNDYLASRDSEFFEPFFAGLGLRVAAVLERMSPEEKAAAYQNSVVYVANKIVVFDYLRDRLALESGQSALVRALHRIQPQHAINTTLPGLQFAIVDEADSVFIDEARTPLVISSQHPEQKERQAHYRDSIELAGALREGLDFVWLDAGKTPRLTKQGSETLAELAQGLGGLWQGPRLREDAVKQALVALWVFRRDIDYIVEDGKVLIVDENTGRVMPDRSWERGLQQLIEIKEGVAPTPLRENLARLSYQAFFRRYVHLCGMTGTCREVAGELGEVYGLGVVRVEPFRPSRRKRLPTRMFARSEQRWKAVVNAVISRKETGQPVVVGTRSVRASERLSDLLTQAGIAHQVLNAKQNAAEADVIGFAGQVGAVTIATNMAGRGTDIKLAPGVCELGGLFVILTEGHDNTRVDRQLAGRCARQGDPGQWQAFLCLEDEVMRIYPAWCRRALVFTRILTGQSPFGDKLAAGFYRVAQGIVAALHAHERKRLMRTDYQSRRTLAFSGESE